jgi:2-polyprenyl-3-methyl-5-hydroxy-6-metoxy-1,4-benzoquinol methylase
MVLAIEEYDASYFDGDAQPLRHNAGYSYFHRWYRFDGPCSSGEYWRDLAATLTERFSLRDKIVLEVGCAKGFIVQDMRDLGVNAFGIDVSTYAVSRAEPSVRPFIECGNILDVVYEENQYDALFSTDFFECVTDATAEILINKFNRIARSQFHLIGTHTNPQFYNVHSLAEWAGFNWKPGTVLLGNGEEVVK